ncbi:MAG: hypothetical protein JOY67_09665 [Hyphomicrobiales bacterium]|nr:hypothetical protein [Hyphomicrobiales bacterium]MBV9113077.1 hypothetical protein [Hyphomicrobiales bacterium]MBV9517652.1 hypothetical protein [Hyphomicrobiales bacterium]
MAGRSEFIIRPVRSFSKLMLGVSTKAWSVTLAVAADSRGTLSIIGARVGRDDDDWERPAAGPDDLPTEREKRDSPIHLGA